MEREQQSRKVGHLRDDLGRATGENLQRRCRRHQGPQGLHLVISRTAMKAENFVISFISSSGENLQRRCRRVEIRRTACQNTASACQNTASACQSTATASAGLRVFTRRRVKIRCRRVLFRTSFQYGREVLYRASPMRNALTPYGTLQFLAPKRVPTTAPQKTQTHHKKQHTTAPQKHKRKQKTSKAHIKCRKCRLRGLAPP